MNSSSVASSRDAGPTVALLYVLLQTFSALGLGLVCVRAGFVELHKGHMRALEFFVGKIALPLLVFNVIATADLGNVQWMLVAACCLGKLFVYVVTFVITYFGYKADRPTSQRILTANIFGFFTTASNDFAIGFPVIHALYGDSMAVYIAANVFIFQIGFQPMAMVIFEMGKALHGMEEHDVLSPAQRCMSFAVKMLQRIFQNLIIIGTLSGILFQLALKHTLVAENGKMQLPHPWSDIIKLWTAPFTMMFLFLNGASLTSARIATWPVLLTLMKVVVCAYVSFFLAIQLLHPVPNFEREERVSLEDYAFFYGTIPAGGAPLIFAQQYDPGVVGLVASASLFGLILAGPVEFMTALFMGTGSSHVQYISIHEVCQVMISASIACGTAFLIYACISWRYWHFAERVIGCYGFVVFLYSLLANFISQQWVNVNENYPLIYLFGFLQNLSYFIVMYLALLLMKESPTRCAHPAILIVILASAALVPLAVTYPNTMHEVAFDQDWASHASAVILGIWDAILFMSTAGVIASGVLRKRFFSSRSLPSVEVHEHSSCDSFSMQQALPPAVSEETAGLSVTLSRSFTAELALALSDTGYSGVVSTLVISQIVRLLMGTVNAAAFAASGTHGAGGFTPMFILVNILEHGQACFLFLAIVIQRRFRLSVHALFSRLRRYGCVFHGLVEVNGSASFLTAAAEYGNSAAQLPQSQAEHEESFIAHSA